MSSISVTGEIDRPSSSSRMARTVQALVSLGPLTDEGLDFLICLDVLLVMTSLSKAYVYQLEGIDPDFPARVKVGSRTAFSLRQTQRWIRIQIDRSGRNIERKKASSTCAPNLKEKHHG